MKEYNHSLYGTAIHEAGHLVARYVLWGNIDTVEYVSIVPKGDLLGQVKEKGKQKEIATAFDNDEDWYEIGGYPFRECCYSIAGVIAEKEILHLESVPWYTALDDLMGLDNQITDWDLIRSFLGFVVENVDCDGDILVRYCPDPSSLYYDSGDVKPSAILATEELVSDNVELIKTVAEALLSAPKHQLDNPALLALLTDWSEKKK